MSEKPKPEGQPIRDDISRMIKEPGVYLCGDSKHPDLTIPLFSNGQDLISLAPSAKISPHHFTKEAHFSGPWLADYVPPPGEEWKGTQRKNPPVFAFITCETPAQKSLVPAASPDDQGLTNAVVLLTRALYLAQSTLKDAVDTAKGNRNPTKTQLILWERNLKGIEKMLG